MDLDPQLARQMFEELGTLVVLGMPPGTEFGIDTNTWNVGEKFKGVKMIPPGMHFVYFSAVSKQGDTAPRTGFFHFFKQKDLVVRHYDVVAEDLKDEATTSEEIERIRANIKNLDPHLGPYPIESWQKWVSLTQYVTCQDVERMVPMTGRICSVPELMLDPKEQQKQQEKRKGTKTTVPTFLGMDATVDDFATDIQARDGASIIHSSPDSELLDSGQQSNNTSHLDNDPCQQGNDSTQHGNNSSQQNDSNCEPEVNPKDPGSTSHRSMPEMIPRPGTELRFCKFPLRPYPDGATPEEVTQCSLDSTYSLKQVIGNLGSMDNLLAEVQFSFVCFLAGQVWEGWEHWRRLLTTLCSAEKLLLEQTDIYLKLLSVIHFQVQEVPEDLFIDIVESENFLAAALRVLFANISDNAGALPASVVSKAQRFKHHLTAKFGWILTLEDDDEDAPVVIETEDMPVDMEELVT